MFRLRKAHQRGHTELSWLDSWHTFSFDQYYDSEYTRFGPIRVINEDTISPKGGFGTHSHSNMEILTYVLQGTLEHKDSLGNGSLIVPGELQRMTAGTGIRHSEYNHSEANAVHLLQIWVIPKVPGLTPSYEQKSFDINPGGGWQLLASPNGQSNSLHINQDLLLYGAKLKEGERLSYDVPLDRSIWLQLTEGKLHINDHEILPGDGVSLSKENLLELRAGEAAHVLLFDLGE